jgi:hypothetical protein
VNQILVTSASGANGDGYGAILSFTANGVLTGRFSEDLRITDPPGLNLDPSRETRPRPAGVFSVDQAALQLQVAPNTVRAAVNRGVVDLYHHRLFTFPGPRPSADTTFPSPVDP